MLESFFFFLLSPLLFLSLSPKERHCIQSLVRWRNGERSHHDEWLIDSTRSYLLMAVKEDLFLIHRKKKWKAKLDAKAEALYTRYGRRAFRRMHLYLTRVTYHEHSTI